MSFLLGILDKAQPSETVHSPGIPPGVAAQSTVRMKALRQSLAVLSAGTQPRTEVGSTVLSRKPREPRTSQAAQSPATGPRTSAVVSAASTTDL